MQASILIRKRARRFQRFPSSLAARYGKVGSAEWHPGNVVNLSIGGAFVETPRPLPFGSILRLEMLVPGYDAPLVVVTTVRWTRAGGMGLQFGLLGARETHAIVALAARRSIPPSDAPAGKAGDSPV